MSNQTGIEPATPEQPEHAELVGETTQRSTRYWIGVLLLLVLLSEEAAYAFSLVTPALPHMAQQFETTQIGWMFTAFQLAGMCTAPLIGKLADAYGKRRFLLLSAAAMILGSLIVAFSPSFTVVLIGRTLEGVGIAIIPITYSLMRDIFPAKLLALAVSISTAGIGLTGIISPNLSGWLLDNHGYRGVFLFLAIFPAIIAALIFAFVPESPIRVRTRIDWVGGLALGLSLALMLLALSMGTTWGWTSPRIIGSAVIGALMLAAWVAYERRIDFPIMDLDLLGSRAVSTTLVANFMAQAVIVINAVLLAYLVQTPKELGAGYGLGESATGLAHITTPAAVASVAMGFAVGWIAQRRGPRLPAWAGFVFAAVGTGMLAFSHYSMTQLFIGNFIYAIGGGLISAAIPNLVIAAVPVAKQAVSANVVGVFGTLGSAVGLQIAFAVLGSHVHTVIQGNPIYADSGFKIVLILNTVFAVLGLLITFVMRHGQRPVAEEATAQLVH